MSLPRLLYALTLLMCLSFVAIAMPPGDDWKTLDSTHLTLKTATVEKDADAEALFWEVRIDDDEQGDLIFTHYLRIKVFTERGREAQSKIDIPFGKILRFETKVKDISARTIKADGTIVELKKEDIFERTIVKTSGVKFKAKSFAIPGIEPGCIIEYRWREVRVNQNANYVRLDFQRDIPVQRITYFIKPYPYQGYGMRSLTLHGETSPFKKEANGFHSTTMLNMPSMHEESRMPPENQIKTWMLIYYDKGEKLIPQKYWHDLGKRYFEESRNLIKVNDDIKRTAAEATDGTQTDEEKIARLYEFCRSKIKNASDDAAGLTPEERKKLKENKSPANTLKRGVGTWFDINMLFAALVTASGMEASVVLAPDRGDMFFDKNIPNSYFLSPKSIAVRFGETWKFYDPGTNYLTAGMLRWQEEGQESLVTDSKQPVWVSTPLSPPDKSRVKRTATLKLDEEGALEGDVQMEFIGHLGVERKEENDDYSPSQREDSLRSEIKAQMSTAEISNLKIENVNDPVKPISYMFHLRVPGYAQRTGKRLFFQPAFFQRGVSPLFSASARKYPVYFHYPWSESDEVTVLLPPGYEFDSVDAPTSISGGIISEYKPGLSATADKRTLVYKRNFFFGGGGHIFFPPDSSYQQLKTFFDQVHKQDNHTITLKQPTN